jgi:hypothetical protein
MQRVLTQHDFVTSPLGSNQPFAAFRTNDR